MRGLLATIVYPRREVAFFERRNRKRATETRGVSVAKGKSGEGATGRAGRDNNVPFIRPNGPVQKLQYPDNPRDARIQRGRGWKSGPMGKIKKKTTAGLKVRADTRVPLRRGKCAVEIEGSRRVAAGWWRQSANLNAGIAEFQWTRWPRKPIAVHLAFSLLSFFFLLFIRCFEKLEGWAFNPNIYERARACTRSESLRRRRHGSRIKGTAGRNDLRE